MNTPSFVQFIGLFNKLLFTAKTSKSKRAIGLRVFALSKKGFGFVPEQDIAIKSLNINQLKKMNKSYVCFLGEINVSQIIIINTLSTMRPSTYHHIFLALCQSIVLNKIYVLHRQRNTLVNTWDRQINVKIEKTQSFNNNWRFSKRSVLTSIWLYPFIFRTLT